MEIEECYSIDELYEQVKEFDLVFTVEAPLADSLNKRIENPILGIFSETPKRYVRNKSTGNPLDKRKLFLTIINQLDIDWKQANYLLLNILDCWKKTGDLKKILQFKEFKLPMVEAIIEILEHSDNIFNAMDKHEFTEDKKVAVINLYQFDGLDKKVLPSSSKYTEINLFNKESKRELPEFNLFNSSIDLIQTIIENIKKVDPNDVAIVLDPASHYQSLIEAALGLNNIPFLIKQKFAENEELRFFITLIRVALNQESIMVKDLLPFLDYFKIRVPNKHNDKILMNVDLGETNFKYFLELLNEIKNLTFHQVIEKIKKLSKNEKKFKIVKEKLSDLPLMKQQVSLERLNQLIFYLDSFEISLESSIGGVLFVSPKAVAYVDRPIVFYIGMDTSWTSQITDKPWINKEIEETKNLTNFKALIQNGEHQYYLVKDVLMNEKVAPCFYFIEINDQPAYSFKDFPHKVFHASELKRPSVAFPKDPSYNVDVEEVKLLSQSQLNSLVSCPRHYELSRLIFQPENFHQQMGIIYHDFAEFYRNHRDVILKKGINTVVKLIFERLSEFRHEIYHDLLRTKIELGLKVIMKYIDEGVGEGTIMNIKLEGYERNSDDENYFSNAFKTPIKTTTTEMSFKSEELGIKGKVDLIQAGDHLLDFKSSQKKLSPATIKRQSNIFDIAEPPNFQAILYLTYLRHLFPDRILKFSFFHFLVNIREAIGLDPEELKQVDLYPNLSVLEYVPNRGDDFLFSEDMFNRLLTNQKTGDLLAKGNDIRRCLDLVAEDRALGYHNYKRLFQTHGFDPEMELEKIEKSALADDFFSHFLSKNKKSIVHKFQKEGFKKMVNKLKILYNQIYFKEDLDEFEEAIKVWIDDLNEYKRSKFPIGELDLDELYIDRSLIYHGRN